MIHRTKPYILLCALLAAFTVGCHKPEFDELQAGQPKWSVAVVAHAESEAQQKQVKKTADELTREQAMTTRISWTPAEKASTELDQMTKLQGLDLLIFEHQVPEIETIARKNPQMRFVLLGEQPAPSLMNVRRIAHDRRQVLFLAGFLAGEANRGSKYPFSVLVDRPRTMEDEEWQLVVAGSRLAGQKLAPLQVVQSELPESAQARSPFSGNVLLLLDAVPETVWPKLSRYAIPLVRTDESILNVPLQDRVLAQPASLLHEALAEEAEALATGKWQGKETIALKGKHTYRLTQPGLFPDPELAARLELYEAQYAAGVIKPENYLK